MTAFKIKKKTKAEYRTASDLAIAAKDIIHKRYPVIADEEGWHLQARASEALLAYATYLRNRANDGRIDDGTE